MPEKDYSFNQQLILEAVKSTYGIPSVVIGTLIFSGAFAGLRLIDWITSLSWPTLPSAPTSNDISTALDKAQVGIVGDEKIRFANDARACLRDNPANFNVFGVDIPDPLRGVKLATCMLRKGWSTDIVGKWARELVGV
jgi:hypothetical protein